MNLSKTPYGEDKEGRQVHISALSGEPDKYRGIKCKLVCPACGSDLIAKLGEAREHHFAHASSSPCEYGLETALHKRAKEILEEEKRINLPEITARSEVLAGCKQVILDKVWLENRLGNIRPDVRATSKEGEELLVEIYVTHEVGKEKIKRIQELSISTIEVDLSDLSHASISDEELRSILIQGTERKKWLYNAVAEHWLKTRPKQAPAKPATEYSRPKQAPAKPATEYWPKQSLAPRPVAKPRTAIRKRTQPVIRKVVWRPFYHVKGCPINSRAKPKDCAICPYFKTELPTELVGRRIDAIACLHP